MTKDQAKQEMIDGNAITHSNYADDEYLTFDGNVIRDENNYNMGSFMDAFWDIIQHWEDGWSIKLISPKEPINQTYLEIKMLPKVEEPFFPKARHSRRGHDRPFKYHK